MRTIDLVKDAIRQVIGKPGLVIDDDDELVSDLGLDSLDLAEVTIAIEEDRKHEFEWDDYFSPRVTAMVLNQKHEMTAKTMAAFVDARL